MKRHLLNLLTAVALLGCVAAVVAWVRSYQVGDYVVWQRASHDAGRPAKVDWSIIAGLHHQAIEPPLPVGGGSHLQRFWQRRGFDYRPTGPLTDPGRVRQEVAALPLWFPPVVAAVGTVPGLLAAWRRRRRRKRAASGRCAECGYDLTGSAKGVCPECGGPT